MKKVALAMTVASFLCLVGGGSALATDSLTLESGGSYTYNDPVYGEIYVGPYTVSVNNGTTTTDLPLVCDDYQTEIYINQNWNATAYTISSAATLSSTVSLLKFGSQGTFGGGVTNATQAYEEIFYLTEQMEQTTNASTIAAIHYAIWDITDPKSAPNGPNGVDNPGATNWLGQALTYYDTPGNNVFNTAEFVVYTPNPASASQEFIEVLPVPEPSALVFLGVSLLMVAGAVRLKVRKTQT